MIASPEVGVYRGGEHGDGRGLARAVGTEQAEDLAFLDVEGNAFDGGEVAVFFDEILTSRMDGMGSSRCGDNPFYVEIRYKLQIWTAQVQKRGR